MMRLYTVRVLASGNRITHMILKVVLTHSRAQPKDIRLDTGTTRKASQFSHEKRREGFRILYPDTIY